MRLGSHKYKDAFDPSQAHLTPAPVIALLLAVLALLEWYKRNATKRSPMGVPGLATFFLAGSIVLLSHCAGTAAKPQECTISIEIKDPFGDLTTVARVGGYLHVFCDGGESGSKKIVQTGNMQGTVRTVRTTNVGNGELSANITWSRSEDREILKSIFKGGIRCHCGSNSSVSEYYRVPRPVLCSTRSQVTCGKGEICSLDGAGKEVCTDAASSRCADADMKTKTFLCPREDDVPLQECRNLQRPGTDWPQFEVPEEEKKKCNGQSCIFTFNLFLLGKGYVNYISVLPTTDPHPQ